MTHATHLWPTMGGGAPIVQIRRAARLLKNADKKISPTFENRNARAVSLPRLGRDGEVERPPESPVRGTIPDAGGKASLTGGLVGLSISPITGDSGGLVNRKII